MEPEKPSPYWSPEQFANWAHAARDHFLKMDKPTHTAGPFQLDFDATKRQWSKRPEVKRYKTAMILWACFIGGVAAALIWYGWSNRTP